ncbi:MAG: 50S ribosomal protein L22 [Candidatus Blackburnbacteria bacterium]|nr:50S ribosomal protein L22 [Candidatus Blackburnbacteria bacterium]
MLIKAEQKYLRTSPRKLRLVADLVRGMRPLQAVDYLEHVGKRAAFPIQKVLKQALANAKNRTNLSGNDLLIKELVVNQGPVYKRFRPVSRGRAHPIKKKTSHIKVILETKNEKRKDKNDI